MEIEYKREGLGKKNREEIERKKFYALKVWTKLPKQCRTERELRKKSVKKKKTKRIGKYYLMLVDCRQPLAPSLPNPRRRRNTHCFALKVDEEEWFPEFLIGFFVLSFVLCFCFI